jgi:hypothetical protein
MQWCADLDMPCHDCCYQVAGRSPTGDSDNTGRANVAALDPVKLAKLRAANEIVRASWQYKVGFEQGYQHDVVPICSPWLIRHLHAHHFIWFASHAVMYAYHLA